MNIKKFLIMTSIALMGIQTINPSAVYGWWGSFNAQKELKKASRYTEKSEYYRARKIVENILKREPENAKAKRAMAEIITAEIAEHKELFETRTPEEFSHEEVSSETLAWLERAQTLFEMGEYDEALNAAEKVFSYEPENIQASQLIDQIRNAALRDGRAESMINNQIAKDEKNDRVGLYLEQAKKAVTANREGEAGFALDKILLLDPENKEALKMRQQLKKNKLA